MNKLYVVGIGPGKPAFMTAQARQALEEAAVLCGYTVYVELVAPLFPGKETYTTPMTKEIDRCRWALQTAAAGKTVALVCSGDAGVYGMAAPLLQLAADYPDVDVEVVAGVTAALSGAAVLGAPLGHDFCVISLSDLLTPWAVIEKRLQCAARGDFAICLYNPSSRKRADYLQRACDILLASGKAPETVCGWVRNIGREGQKKQLLTLEELRDVQLDMFTTVFIGSAGTRNIQGNMVTARGYEAKCEW
ncbi:MAG: precorrin-3B C(17)-methyltransferase [Candidatus Limivicinus sp.]